MRVEIGQVCERAGLLEDCPNGARVRPSLSIKSDGSKSKIVARGDFRFWKKRVLRAEAFLLAQEDNPIDKNLADVVADREKPRRKGLRSLRLCGRI
jgi:hypothetical protein